MLTEKSKKNFENFPTFFIYKIAMPPQKTAAELLQFMFNSDKLNKVYKFTPNIAHLSFAAMFISVMEDAMKKSISLLMALLMLLLLLPVSIGKAAADDRFLEIDEANFPDAYFRAWVIDELSVSGDDESGYYMTEAQVEAVSTINCDENYIGSLTGIEHFTNLTELHCEGNRLTELDISSNGALKELRCSDNSLTSIGMDNNAALLKLDCRNNRLEKLDLSSCTKLKELSCDNNHLCTLNVSKLKELTKFTAAGQTIKGQIGTYENGIYTYSLKSIMGKKYLTNVTVPDSTITFQKNTGEVTFASEVESFVYRYDAGTDPDGGDIVTPELPVSVRPVNATQKQMEVRVYLTFERPYEPPAFEGTVEWNANDVQFKGTTPYVIANGTAQTPRFTVKDANGNAVDASNYTYTYLENVRAGTAYVILTFKAQYTGTARAWFKIYLPPTEATTVENVSNGIRIRWSPVEGAAGYVIYRRAWSSTTNGWTSFVRWNNTTALEWIDGSDASHNVFAGTRYQYGIKAYFARRTDPVTDAVIGGNVGDNFNLGEVGPLKTTVRITTRTLNSVTPGNQQLTAKWAPSSVFTGYQVQTATDSAFQKNVKTVKIDNPKTSQVTVSGLNNKTVYYVRVRSYHLFEGMNYYGEWSNTLDCKVQDPATFRNYVLNKSTFKFHYQGCKDVAKIIASNRIDYYGARDDLIEQGYSPCGHCHP